MVSPRPEPRAHVAPGDSLPCPVPLAATPSPHAWLCVPCSLPSLLTLGHGVSCRVRGGLHFPGRCIWLWSRA